MPLKIYYPHKPYFVTQRWGVPNPNYAQHFNDPSFRRHNGIDASTIAVGEYGKQWPIYCPVAGFRVESVTWEPNGGGNQLSLLSKEPMDIFGTKCWVRLFICHGHKILVSKGYEPALGELLMIANNTGFSTGPHTHFGMYRVDKRGRKIDTNEATGSFDPSLFFADEFAIDKASLATLTTSVFRYWKYKLSA
jgi:murein DD-endopeptidase MepM/ murein hydrolase activator NlpD